MGFGQRISVRFLVWEELTFLTLKLARMVSLTCASHMLQAIPSIPTVNLYILITFPFLAIVACVRVETTVLMALHLGAVDSIAHIFGGSAIHAYKDLNSGYATGYMSNWS